MESRAIFLRTGWTPPASGAQHHNKVANIRELYVLSPDAAFQDALHCLFSCLNPSRM
jgi:hypothetical protein